MLAWILLAGLNAIHIWLVPWRASDSRLRVRLIHQFYDAGHLVGAGVAVFVAVWLVSRWRLKWRWGVVAAAALAALVAVLALADDLSGFVGRQEGWLAKLPWTFLIAGAAAVGSAVMVALGHLVDRPKLRWVGVAAGLALAITNQLVLTQGYPGFHLMLAWNATLLIGTSLAGARHPVWSTLSKRRRSQIVFLIALIAYGSASVLVPAPRSVWSELLRVPGAVFAPFVSQLAYFKDRQQDIQCPVKLLPWFESRATHPPIPPSEPQLLGADAIVILMVIDAARADLVASTEYDDVLPHLKATREGALHFRQAWTPAPSTLSALLAVFSGKYYSQTYWTSKGNESVMPHDDDSVRFPALLSRAGTRTVHVLSITKLAPRYGVGRGFDDVILATRSRRYARTRKVMKHALKRLARYRGGRLFLFMHHPDPHAPYTLGGKEGPPFERYLREVALVDAQLGRLRAFLSARELWDQTVLIVAADHGEAFLEHGQRFHSTTLYEEVVRVPLLIVAPGVEARVVDDPVSLIDLGPTILDLFGLPTPGAFMGQSLVAYLRGESPELTRPIAVDAPRRLQAMVFSDGVKAIIDLRHHTAEVYDLRRDPTESHDLVDVEGFDADRYLAQLRAFFRIHTLKRPGWKPPWRRFSPQCGVDRTLTRGSGRAV